MNEEQPNETVDLSASGESSHGSVVGNYKLLEPVGEGGMGVVYLAEQQRPVRRMVALKIIKPGMDTKQVIARFEAERQALAMMDHPNIARVLDAGSTAAGRPYFVMELVRGVPITEYCDKHRLTPRERLSLFMTVCQGVQHAHTKGIIHRDLKPSNVLVTLHDGEPVSKIIDFGVAKATNNQLTDKTLYTGISQLVGTPLYMSPEQAEMSGLDIDTRSDIYSLGVLLYELLTSTTPFDKQQFRTAGYDEVRRIIREEEPARPSTKLSSLGDTLENVSAKRQLDAKRLGQELRGELDWIVMKTLEKDRTRRYETANALADDVRRYLDGDTVLACPPSTAYRLRKFASRHKAQVTVAASFLLLLVASTAVAWLLYADARTAHRKTLQARDDLEIERDRALDAEREAEENLATARVERDRAAAERTRADQIADELRQRLYDYHFAQANAAYREDKSLRAIELLEACHEEQRSWEWRYLRRLADMERQIELPGPPLTFYALEPGGDRLAAGNTNGEVRVYDLATGQTLWTQPSGQKVTVWVAFSRDGKWVASCGIENYIGDLNESDMTGTLAIWDSVTGEKKWEVKTEDGIFLFPKFSPDGKHIAVSGGNPIKGNGFLELRQLDMGSTVWSQAIGMFATMAEFSPTGERLYLTSTAGSSPTGDSVVRCLNVADKKEIWKVERQGASSHVTVDPTGERLITGGPNHTLQIWNAAQGEIIEELQSGEPDSAFQTVFHPNAERLVSVGSEGHIAVWDWTTKKVIRSLRANVGYVGLVEYTQDGQHLISAGAGLGRRVQFWRAEPLAPSMTLPAHEAAVKAVAFHPNGEQVASGGPDATLRIWSGRWGQELKTIDVERAVLDLRYSPDGQWIATAGVGGVKLWNASTGELVHQWSQIGTPWWLAFSHSGKQLIAAGDMPAVKLFDVDSRQEAGSFPYQGKVDGVAFAPDDKSFVTTQLRVGKIVRWDIATKQSQELRPGSNDNSSRAVSFHPRLQQFAVGVGRTIEIWGAAAGTLRHTWQPAGANISVVLFNNDGTRLVSADSRGTIRVWNFQTGEELYSLQAHEGRIWSLAFSPDGDTLASAGEDGLLKLWETVLPTAEIVQKRRRVSEALRLVNQSYRESPKLRDVVKSLTADETLNEDVLAVALEMANSRGDRGRGPMVAPPQSALGHLLAEDMQRHLGDAQKSLVKIVQIAAGADFEAGHEGGPQSVDPGQWFRSAYGLAAPNGPLPLPELIGLLTPLVQSHPRAHQFVFLRGLAHARRGDWLEADRDLSQALELVNEKTTLWHEYAFRLTAVLAHRGEWERYQQLCRKTIRDFGETNDVQTAERTLKMCLFPKTVHVDLKAAGKLADRFDAGQSNPVWLRKHLIVAQGIADLRRENYERAAERFNDARDQFRNTGSYNVIAIASELYLAIALHHSGDADQAKQMFTRLEAVLKLVPDESSADFPGWTDWIVMRMAFTEARALMQPEKQD